MRKISKIASTVLLLSAGCSGPTHPTVGSDVAHPGFTINSLTPGLGSAGTQVVISGSGFMATGNTVRFEPRSAEASGQMPAEPSVIPNLSSENGRTIVFSVLLVWRPACSYSPPGPCPIANIPTAPGTYAVSVMNANGLSNSVAFVVSR
jgi:hypothetical protein